ncbi:uncharacterized protein Np [Diabrotica undecimpunctata]|uniref:uncharacterized protein Np n=1 Tax=Diabrotica undecimpunctata TaxID=50387 RepID=UPI003B63792F
MLPAALVTLVTFLLELCSSSPVYNMQPAFITNTVGSTAGRNIRNLPCISRRNSNLSGYCMFAIDCLKANGTHLGTCIDGFYFGSCCHIEPVKDIIDNNIDTDIIPHREPPFRISSTTSRTASITSAPKNVSSTTLRTSTTTRSKSTSTTKIPVTSSGSMKPVSTTTSKLNISSSTTTISTSTSSTTLSEKLQTFQVINTNHIQEEATKPSVMTTVQSSSKPVTKQPVTVASTKSPSSIRPLSSSTAPIKPITKRPVQISTTSIGPSNLTSATPTYPNVSASTTKVSVKPSTQTTLKPVILEITNKPTKTTRSPPTRATQKPTKATKPTLATKKTQSTAKATTTSTKPTRSTAKPTKRVTPSTEKSTTTKPSRTTTQKIVTKSPSSTLSTSTHRVSSSTPPSSTSTTTESTTVRMTTSKPNNTQTLQTVSGNVATNEIEDSHHSQEPTTSKPGSLITWTVVDNRNSSTTASDQLFNTTTEDWVPITTPDGWVLLPSVSSNATMPPSMDSSTTALPSSSLSPISTSSSSFGPITLPTPFDKPTVQNVTTEAPTATASSSSISSSTIEVVTVDNETEEAENSTINTTPPLENFAQPVNMSDFTDVCGRRMYPEARIVGGEKSSFGKWPWQISLRQWRTSTYLHKCGAALLNENWAITAAHCVDNVPPSDLLLRLGEHDLSTESEPYLHQERRVQIVASHPQFDPRTFEYDLALLRFYEPVTFQPNILPVCVPQSDENFVGRTAYVTGWGRLYEDGPLPSVLQEVSVPVINNTVCESMYRAAGYIEHIPHIFICAGWRRGGFDSCEGDSGGPMVIQRQDNRFLLAGVISWGIGCAEPNQPGVYTRISEFRDWINQILQF